MQTNKYLLLAIKIGLGIILFTPLFVTNNMFFPFITGKNFIFRTVVEILLVLWVILMLRDRRYLPHRSWILIFVAASTAVVALGTIFGVDVSRSFWSNFERMEGLLGHLHFLVYFLILAGVNRTERDWWRFFHISFVASALVGIYALFQLGGVFEIHQGGVRIDSTLGNATYLAVYMLFHVFLVLYYFLKTRNAYAQIFYGALMLFATFILYQTATRGAILGLVGGLFIFALTFGFLSKERRLKFLAIGLLVFLMIITAGFFALKDSKFVKGSNTLGRLSNISIQDDDAQARFSIWKMSFEGFKERPILGWGPENYAVVFSKYYDPTLWRREPWFDRSHNIVLDWLTNGGIFGLIAYLGIFASAVRLLIKKYLEKKVSNIELSVFLGLLGGFFFQNLFVFDQLTSYIMFLAVLGYIHFISRGETLEKSAPLVPSGQVQVFSAVALIAILPIIYFFNMKPLVANLTLLSALENANIGKFEEAQTDFKRAISLSPLGRREAREQYAHFATLIATESKIPEAIRISSVTDAVKESELEVKDSPLDARSHLFLGSIYGAAGRRADSLKAFEDALMRSPKKQQIIFLVAQMYLDMGQNDKAVELATFGANLDPTYGDAQHNLISIQILAGKDEAAFMAIEKLILSGGVTADNIKSWGSLFASKKKFDDAIKLYKTALAGNPADTQTRVSLAASYYESGRSDLAIAEIQKAIEMDPSFKGQGDEFIKQIQTGAKPQ